MLQYRRVTGAIVALLVAMVTWTGAALALEPVSVTGDIDAIDLLPAVQSYSSQGDSINIAIMFRTVRINNQFTFS